MKNIIITGAAGFIGSLMVDRFYREGYRVFAIVRHDSNISAIEDKAKIIACDYNRVRRS